MLLSRPYFYWLYFYIVAQVFIKPVKLLWKLLINSATGLVPLLVFNYPASYFDFSLPIKCY